jgi:hypothetical protein
VYHRISIIGSVASFELEISAFVYHRISIIGSVQPPLRSPLAALAAAGEVRDPPRLRLERIRTPSSSPP